jgi:hypothetical protein
VVELESGCGRIRSFEVVVVKLESGCGQIQAFRGGSGRARNSLWSNSRF